MNTEERRVSIPAKFPGYCHVCRKEYEAGVTITRAEDHWVHWACRIQDAAEWNCYGCGAPVPSAFSIFCEPCYAKLPGKLRANIAKAVSNRSPVNRLWLRELLREADIALHPSP